MHPEPVSYVSYECCDYSLTLTYLVEVLQQIHYSSLYLLPRQTSRSRVESYARNHEGWG